MPSVPRIAPAQKVPLIAMSTLPAEAGRDQLVDRRIDGSVFPADTHTGDEPGDVKEDDPARAIAQGECGETAATRYTPRVIMNRLRRPNLSDGGRKQAPTTSPARYTVAMSPTAAEDRPSVSGCVQRDGRPR